MKNQNSSRVSFIRARYFARFASLAGVAALSTGGTAAPSPAPAPSALSSPANLPPVKSVHVWRKTARDVDAQGEALPAGYVPAPVPDFIPAIDPEIDAEIRPQAYADALPEIGFAHFSHLANCAPLCLTWRG